jgi:hypothetical protein
MKRSWYSQTFDDDEEESIQNTAAEVEPADSCEAAARQYDVGSDASTDVGEDEEDRSDLLDLEADEPAPARHVHERPSFLKASRQQKIAQSKRVVDEFANLEFDSVDASSQQSLVMRKLVLLKSLTDTTVHYSGRSRIEETRISLLGLHKDEAALDEITFRAQQLCEVRQFRAAFNVLQEAIVRIYAEARTQMSAEEIEEMSLRRLQKRQRQREERREQRREDRKERSAQKKKGRQIQAFQSTRKAVY